MKSSIIKRSVSVGRRLTSVSLEDAFWDELKKIAHARGVTPSRLIENIDVTRNCPNLSSAIRQFVLQHCQISQMLIADARRARDAADGLAHHT